MFLKLGYLCNEWSLTGNGLVLFYGELKAASNCVLQKIRFIREVGVFNFLNTVEIESANLPGFKQFCVLEMFCRSLNNFFRCSGFANIKTEVSAL